MLDEKQNLLLNNFEPINLYEKDDIEKVNKFISNGYDYELKDLKKSLEIYSSIFVNQIKLTKKDYKVFESSRLVQLFDNID